MRIVSKFGGAAIKDAKGINQVVRIIKDLKESGNEVIVVVSALGGVTDALLGMMKNIPSPKKNWIDGSIDSISAIHLSAIKAITDSTISQQVTRNVRNLLGEMKNVVLGMSHVGELTPRSRDLLLSFGERLSAPIIAGALTSEGLAARWLTGGDAGIVTDDNFGEAEPLMNVTTMQVQQNLEPILKENVIPVVCGFIANTQDGAMTTLGRGGSDYSAAIIGLALKADLLQFWKEVPGIMTADPSICPQSRLIGKIAFDEAIEIAHFGARVIHPRALEIGMDSDLTYQIRYVWEPNKEGTLVVKSTEPSEDSRAIIRAISVIDRVHLINISGARLVGTPRVAGRVLELLANEDIDVLMISQSSSEANMSIAVPEADADEAMNALELFLLGSKLVREISGEAGYCIIATVGRGMRGTPGVAAKVFQSMANHNINIRTIAQGSSELNISFMVSRKDMKAAVNALHADFGLDKT